MRYFVLLLVHLLDHPSVHPLVYPLVSRSITLDSKMQKTRIYDAVVIISVCGFECVEGGLRGGVWVSLGVDAPAHLSATML